MATGETGRAARDALAPLVWRRHRFTATVGRRGRGPDELTTVCLYDLADEATGEAMAQHVWASYGGEPVLAGVRFGERVALRATVRPYEREDGTTDYCLCKLRGVVAIAGAGESQEGEGE